MLPPTMVDAHGYLTKTARLGVTRQFVGIPYVAHAATYAGADCFGLVALAYWEVCGVRLQLFNANADLTTCAGMETAYRTAVRVGAWHPVGTPQAFDVIMFTMQGHVSHCGLLLDGKHMLHVMKGINTSVEVYKGFKWRNRIAGYYRCAGLEKAPD